MIHSYGSIYNLGHRALAELLDGPVVVEEKVDGSQFSFGYIDGELVFRSKGKELVADAPEKMFTLAVENARFIHNETFGLTPGWVYRAEYLQKPKHNTLCYERVPAFNLALFDVDAGEQAYLSPDEKAVEARRLGLELVPVLFQGQLASFEEIQGMMARQSFLGGTTPEGLVIKNYARYGPDKKVLMGKYVTEAFKEKHVGEWRAANPTRSDVVQDVIATFKAEGRWRKAIQHLRDDGKLTESPKDIGPLLVEVGEDVLKECKQEIADRLFAHAWPQIRRGITAGLPQWYKDELAKQAFGGER